MTQNARRISISLASFLIIITCLLAFTFPFLRLYLSAKFGSSKAMYELAIEYASSSRRIVNPNAFKHDYWLRESAKKGNLSALMLITNSWNISNPHEVVYWLKHGCDQGIPWCAEELTRAYAMGRYRLPIDYEKKGKVLEYDNLAVELHRKKGTLKEHACALLPWVSPSVWPRPDPTEIHPGIPWKSVANR